MLHSPKLAILQSLDAMDKVQMEEVLTYIKGILNQPEKLRLTKGFEERSHEGNPAGIAPGERQKEAAVSVRNTSLTLEKNAHREVC
jgi:hypothetical protein